MVKSVPKSYEASDFQTNKRNVIITSQIPTTSNQNNSPAALFLPSSGYQTPPNAYTPYCPVIHLEVQPIRIYWWLNRKHISSPSSFL